MKKWLNLFNPPSRTLLMLLGLVWLTGCAAPKQDLLPPAFWPPPPDMPRVQFLTSFKGTVDFRSNSALSVIAFGQDTAQKDELFLKPHGLSEYDGKIFMADSVGARIFILDFKQNSFALLKGNMGFGALKKPLNLTHDADGNLYVADAARREVLVYDREGNYLRALGKRQQIDMRPIDLAYADDRLYVVDVEHSMLRVLDPQTGQEIGQMGNGDDPESRTLLPIGLTRDDKGFLWVSNMATGRMMKFDRDGHCVDQFGQLGDTFGMFTRPKGLAVDDQNRLYVVDAGHGNVQIFDDQNRVLMFFGDPLPDNPQGFMQLPADILVTNNLVDQFQSYADPHFQVETVIFVTNQYGTNRLAVYGLGSYRD
jgi:sugar lactone lactonase YvrE